MLNKGLSCHDAGSGGRGGGERFPPSGGLDSSFSGDVTLAHFRAENATPFDECDVTGNSPACQHYRRNLQIILEFN